MSLSRRTGPGAGADLPPRTCRSLAIPRRGRGRAPTPHEPVLRRGPLPATSSYVRGPINRRRPAISRMSRSIAATDPTGPSSRLIAVVRPKMSE